MSEAAKQCRKWIESNYPGVRISRKSCRDTAGGSVSQHSAYKSGVGSYDSNALDIFGPEELDYELEREFVSEIVDALELHRDEWSVRLLLWDVDGHYGHAHIDYWPTLIDPPKWCGRELVPRWLWSDGRSLRDVSPEPENGYYTGPTEEDDLMPRSLFEDMIRALFDIDQAFQPNHGATYWIKLIDDPDNPEWLDFWAAFTTQLTKGDPS